MKKFKKKISYIVKSIMAIGLLFTNIMPFSVVLAEGLDDYDQGTNQIENGNENNLEENNEENKEGEVNQDLEDGEEEADEEEKPEGTDGEGEDPTETPSEDPPAEDPIEEVFTIELTDEYQVVVKYTGEYPESGSLDVSENMTYIDGTNSGDVNTTIELTDDVKAALSGDGYAYDSQLFMENQFPGEYSATATMGEKSTTYNETMTYSEMDFEMDIIAYEEDALYGAVITPDENGKYVIDKDYKLLYVIGFIGQGNACPSMTFTYGGTEYSATEIANGIELENMPLEGHLYGEFDLPLTGTFTDCHGQVNEISENRTIAYGTYEDDTNMLNESAKSLGLDSKYIFFGDSANGYVYNLDEVDSADIESIVKDAFGESGAVEYTVVTGNDEVSITLTDEYGTEVVYTGATLSDDTKIVARFDSDTDEVSSGDTFTLSYVVTLKDFMINGISGLVTYDKELVQLNKMSASIFTNGNNQDDSYTYFGDAIGGNEESEEVTEEEYVLLTLTFEALKAGEATISTEKAKFYNASEYYEADGEISKTIIINESTDNGLSSLTVGGQDIALEDDELDYEITVGNDVTSVDVEALAANSNAKVSIVAPGELKVGANTITIEVKAENGDVKVYTVTVNREEAKEESSTNVSPMSYQEDNVSDNDDDDTPEITPTPSDSDSDVIDPTDGEEKGNNITRIIIIILILLAIAGLIYLIFKDEDDEETQKANKDIEKFKKEDEKPTKKVDNNKKPKKKGR